MMYKNAGIKSKKEAAQRLLNGEEFFYQIEEYTVQRISFSEDAVTNPFQMLCPELWELFERWELEVKWYENLGDGVLCWVWDFDEKAKSIAIVTEYHEDASYPYLASCGWGNAAPVKPGELGKFVYKHE